MLADVHGRILSLLRYEWLKRNYELCLLTK